ncbi:MAG: hypothetical protein BroJett011_51990 [Chloroflexota bacterium]|nr:MAG: hypothetical protein BroJett011_51990 [Chloroflexota bacterium]
MALLGITAFVLALIFGLAIVFMLEARTATPDAGPIEGVARVITTILLAMTFVNVALSAMFMSAHDYSNWLNREMPQPIFAQESRLLGVIEDSLREKIQRATSKNKVVETTITDIERTADAGVILLISTETDADQVSEKEAFKQLQSWRIMANRWGRIQKLQTEGTPRYIVIEKKPAEADKDAETENGKVEPAKEGELIIAGESFNSQSETTISIASNRRHWMG